jgi:hypothetical protein
MSRFSIHRCCGGRLGDWPGLTAPLPTSIRIAGFAADEAAVCWSGSRPSRDEKPNQERSASKR